MEATHPSPGGGSVGAVRWETTGVCGPGGAENQGEEPKEQRVGQEE